MKVSPNPVAKREGMIIQEMPDEMLVYDTGTNKAYCLNKTSAFVWRSCDGSHSVDDIAALMEKEFGANVPDDLIWLAIDQLAEDKLLESSESASGITRREMIRKAGIASAIALPVVISLVAPSSAMASANCACINPPSCGTQIGCPSLTNCNGSGVCAP